MLVEADHPPHCVFFNHPEPFMQGPDELMKTLTQYVFSTGSVELINSSQALDLAESGAITVTLAQTMLNNPQSWLSAPLLADKVSLNAFYNPWLTSPTYRRLITNVLFVGSILN
ncbi:MAG: hypothetical protein ABF267_05290 [Glaciecola sp.]|jgi:hypothetical protein